MKLQGVIAVAALLAGIPLAAVGLTHGSLLLAFGGLALVLVFIYLAWAWIAGASKPMGGEAPIKPSANAAWSMKDEPVQPRTPNNNGSDDRK
jgi:hypothetical protein